MASPQAPPQVLPTTPPRLDIQALSSPLAGPFDLALRAGECLAVTGASGSGKSLFLRMIADLDPNSGRVCLDGTERADFSAPEWRRRVSYVAAESGWWRERAREHFAADRLSAAEELARRLGLREGVFDDPVQRLSTGERQRLALIRALVLDPPVLLLDEPTGPLDPDSTARIEALLRERLAAGATMVLVSHDRSQAERLGAIRRVMRERKLEAAA